MYQMTLDDIINVLITNPYKRNPNYDDSDLVAAAKEIHKDPEKWDDFKFKLKYANEDIRADTRPFFAKVEARTTTENGKIVPKKKVSRIYGMEVSELWNVKFPPRQWIAKDIITTGILNFAARPKIGKSFLMMQLCDAVAKGELFLGKETIKSNVWYLDLEKPYDFVQERLRLMFGEDYVLPEGFKITAQAAPGMKIPEDQKVKKINEGLVDQLAEELAQNPKLKLIVIDVLQKVRDNKGVSAASSYANDYAEIGRLQEFAASNGVCIALVSHTTKEADDFRGALEGIADTNWKLQKEGQKITLTIGGNGVREDEIDIKRGFNMICENKGFLEDQKLLAEHSTDPLFITIRSVTANEGKEWESTAPTLRDLCKNENFDISDTDAQIGTKLSDHAHLLQLLDGIEFSSKHTNKGNKYFFKPIK